jgi:hypothetical protein
MDRNTFLKLAEVSEALDEELALIEANKLLGTDLTDVIKAAAAVNGILGKGDVGGRIGDGTDDNLSTATFGGFTGEAKTYPIAIVRLIVAAVKGMSLDKFLAGKATTASKRDAGQGAAPIRSMGLSRF